MKILVGNKHLKAVGGSETFTYTLIEELVRQKHLVEYFTPMPGDVSKRIEEELGIYSSSTQNYDLIITGQKDTVDLIKQQGITGPVIQVCHGMLTPGEQPNQNADGHIAISEEVQNHLKELGIDAPVILNGINCRRFKPTKKARKIPKIIASLVQTDEAHDIVEAAAKIQNLKVIRLNKYQDKIWDVEKEINKADLVVSLGRGCFEAMACARPVIIFDQRRYHPQKGDGYLEPSMFADFAKNNCSGRFSNKQMNIGDMVDEIGKYDWEHGPMLREIALSELNIEKQTKKILDYAEGIMDNYNYPGTVDVVYILGRGSTWQNNEIRYSIRSFEKHFKDLRNIVIVGEKPSFVRGAIHIPASDKMNVNKDCRMAIKIKAACKDPRVSENFILCTDDTMLLKDLGFEDFTGWHEGRMLYDAEKDMADHKRYAENEKNTDPSRWFEFVYNTGVELEKRGLPDNNYDRAHCPQPVNKEEFLQVISEWDMENNQYTISNIYNNSSKLFEGKNIDGKNLKVYGHLSMEQLKEVAKDKYCINMNDNGLNEAMRQFLLTVFPNPSKHEIFITQPDRRVAAEQWFRKGCDYDEGIEIFKHFVPKNIRLYRFFEAKKGNPMAAKKLQSTLRLWLR